MPRVAAQWAWLPEGLHPNVAVSYDAVGQITAVEQLSSADAVQPGILLPGLVNAHAHLELSHLRDHVAGGDGTVAWVKALMASGLPPDPDANDAAARQAKESGTHFIIDVSNRGDTESHLRAAALRGVIQIECIGVSEGRWGPSLAAAATRRGSRQIAIRPTAHSPISCAPELLMAALRPSTVSRTTPWPTIHCDEHPDDSALLDRREGPWAAFHDRIGHNWRSGLAQGRSGVSVLQQLGLLRPELGLVHLVSATSHDLDAIAAAGSTAILCPRSNLHISSRLPDVSGLIDRDIPLAIGTDSLASTPDMDLLAEASTLRAALPDVSAAVWIQALTTGGARLLGSNTAGSLKPQTYPGLLHVHLPVTERPLEALLDGSRWPRSNLT